MQANQWQSVQNRTFTKWFNTKLSSRDLPSVFDLRKDLSDGILLIQLLEIIGDENLGRYNRNPRMRVHRLENVNKALEYIKSKGMPLTNIGPADIVDGNLKLILGLIWTLILRFTIADINEEGLTAKEGLLLWCQRKTANYHPEVDVQDFTRSWTNGLAFCALIHQHRPDLLDYNKLDKKNHRANMQLAFDIAQKSIGIPRLIEVEDVCDVDRPDERSIMTYVAEYFHAFSTLDKVETAARRVERFTEVLMSTHDMKIDYESRMKRLLGSIARMQEYWHTVQFENNYTDVKSHSNNFAKFKATEKREWVKEKIDLESLLGTIQTNLKTYQLRKYEPPAGLKIVDLERQWKDFLSEEANQSKLINTHMREIKESMRIAFADRANSFSKMLSTISNEITNLQGDWRDQLDHVEFLQEHLGPLEVELASVKVLYDNCFQAGIEENDYTMFSYEDLEHEFGITANIIANKIKYLENELLEREKRTLSKQELDGITKVFRHFEKKKSNMLNEVEFYAALASLGLVYDTEEGTALFHRAANSEEGVTYERFTEIVMEELEDRDSARQVLYAFCDVADGKSYVTSDDLLRSQVRPNIVKFLECNMNKHSEGLDYLTWIKQLLAEDKEIV
ncbi:alpha-actinin [Schizosaccharomyces pombe]|uniref:Alpha-actinin-like protein 1 n=1 Tax=Schizosaccharomyces pombe (strain 972 / ATCC 24843) TaxID=284812 RepID=AIN1_SCHPO|nr:alpha-actinin [Schizosaccharomyces pombe]O13728.1 RecName: Full=Alpha-actinin-like protein 1 [Schizosaccharomyces pombe 972h-]CAB10105.1 alpha-actinin [Schizosaccharomyces pombe]|eukprot:NP_594295.1 alpha-actinin [Schizosaccharomyces pombe]